MLAVSFVLASLCTLALGKPLARTTLQVHESRDSLPSGYSLVGQASPDTQIKLRIALAQSNPDGLIDALYDVSTPTSAHYRQHLSKEEVEQYVAPTSDTVSAVNSWLKENNIEASTISPAGDWLSFSVSVGQANELFDANFSVFNHTATGTVAIQTMQYSIPSDLKGHLELVHPTITFPNPYAGKAIVRSTKSLPKNATVDARPSKSSCTDNITPSCLQSLYGIPSTPASGSGSQLAVSGFINQFANQNDLKTFLETYRPDMSSSTTFSLETIDGGSNSQAGARAGDEANLDIQYTVGLATNVPVTFISVGNDYQDGELEGFLDIINYLLGQENPPQVLTTSYGDDENQISRSLSNTLCNAYAQLGARGVSILFATGDYGVAGDGDQSCSKSFVPTFPSGCPYITTVGATNGDSPETAATLSAGGFSNYFGIPSYQSSAVSSYLQTLGRTDSGKYNASGRGYPDVSAAGVAFNVIKNGKDELLDGTSCASPTFASVVALVNDKLISAGQAPLGFLNPFLYSNPSALNDITSGDNPGCNTNGFPAASGWDPVSGLGSPNYPGFLSALGL